jgi:acetylornithine/succinyldiaminopimelate/putrescine aminotransferase
VVVVGDARVCGRVEVPARACRLEDFSPSALSIAAEHSRGGALVLFLSSRLSDGDRRALDELLRFARERQMAFVGVVSTLRAHFGDQGAAEAEAYVLAQTRGLRTVVFRPAFVLSRNSAAGTRLRRLAFAYPLVPRRLRSCCVDGAELFAAIEHERCAPGRGGARLQALLGPNRSWREILAERRAPGFRGVCLTGLSAVLALLLIGHLAALVLALLVRRRPSLRYWNFDTLRPKSFSELLALYNRHNYRHVKIVGYNNGIIHFGQRYPGKTVVSTVNCNRVGRVGADVLKADCGVTVRKARDFLSATGQELYVVPNYSYVCLGTSFFIPIHGSAADFSTIADTIVRVVLYDPLRGRIIAASRGDPAFRDSVYNLETDVLLLRLYLRVKSKSRYYMHRETLHEPNSADLLKALQDPRATNVEIRKSRASSDTVTVCKYYNDPGDTSSPVLELPRDTLGRLWDRLEENAVTSFLMHALTRYFAWHVELFFTADEFAMFWESHRELPLRKLQLRYIRRDRLPHSPFRDNDCVSVDLFMLRRHHLLFEDYLRRTFGAVRTNPGKHSRSVERGMWSVERERTPHAPRLTPHALPDTYREMLRQQVPNLLRLYLNPYVTQTCFCLTRYVQTTWGGQTAATEEYQTFLANGFDEALSGAIKLARYSASMAGRPTTGLVIDAANRLGPFAGASVAGGGRVEFVPGLTIVEPREDFAPMLPSDQRIGFLVVVAAPDESLEKHADAIRRLVRAESPLLITCVDRDTLAALRAGCCRLLRGLAPDITLFDESFVDHAVPFSAFTARKALYDHWNRPDRATFHSTTYQPNTISSLHFMNCLRNMDAEFHACLAEDLNRIKADLGVRRDLFARLYSPSLCRAARATGFDTANIRAVGDFLFVDGRRIFDAVSGVACSVRGHNPTAYAQEIEDAGSIPDPQAEVASRLRALTGLECMLPAVSGATAVENALKIALVVQFPRRHILALKAGFGGKTLLALSGTANPSYKEHIDPLYPDVIYVDPFAQDAESQIEAALAQHPVAVVQVELVQAVGGVRRVPERVIRYLEARRQDGGYLLLVDEVQTGMFRTGALALSRAMGVSPDLLLLGKGTSDMMFPFALVLYSAAIQSKLDQSGSDLPAVIRKRYGYVYGYRTVLNVLRRAEELSLSRRVAESSDLFARLLGEGLASCMRVREVRVFGLLIGIELEARRWPQRWFRKRLYGFYVFGMLRHRQYPVLVGFCQYEPNVLKITPSLTIAPDQIRQVCATIVDVLRQPFHRLLVAVVARLIKSFLMSLVVWRKKG